MTTKTDMGHMRAALALARQGLGRTWPCPSVGCVIVKDGIVVGRARSADGGRPHAETQALEQAGAEAKGATVYVTLEPCAHHGETPPCAEALVKAGVKRVVVGTLDNDSRVSGKGIEILEKNGIQVEVGVCQIEARDIHMGHFLRQSEKRPFVTLKTASTLDAKIATGSGESKWITGDLARQVGHLERSKHDAVIVGVGTVLADNPKLTVRHGGAGPQPVRVVFDTNLRTPESCGLFEDLSTAPLWIICGEGADRTKMDQLMEQGAVVIEVPRDGEGHCHIRKALETLATMGLTRVMVEGGAGLVTSFLKAGLYDRILWFKAATLLGGGAKGAVDNLPIHTMAERIDLKCTETRALGADRLEIYEKAA